MAASVAAVEMFRLDLCKVVGHVILRPAIVEVSGRAAAPSNLLAPISPCCQWYGSWRPWPSNRAPLCVCIYLGSRRSQRISQKFLRGRWPMGCFKRLGQLDWPLSSVREWSSCIGGSTPTKTTRLGSFARLARAKVSLRS